MIGSLISMAGYWVVVFFLVLWMVIKSFRSSPILALAMFIFWPVALIVLIRNWGDEESDIRTPFFLALLAGGMGVYMAGRAVDKAIDEAAPYMSDQDIALIRREDPEMADRIEAAREAYWAEEDGEDWYDEESAESTGQDAVRTRTKTSTSSSSTAAVAAPRRETSEAEQRAARQQSLLLAASGLSFQYGEQAVPDAKASLSLPKRFRLAPTRALPMMARLRDATVTPALRGWLIHEGVDMSRDDAWVVEWHVVSDDGAKTPALAMPVALRVAVDSEGRRDGPLPMLWSEDGEQVQWSSLSGDGDTADVFAARRVHGGWFVFAFRKAGSDRQELAMRATRWFASLVRSTDRA